MRRLTFDELADELRRRERPIPTATRVVTTSLTPASADLTESALDHRNTSESMEESHDNGCGSSVLKVGKRYSERLRERSDEGTTEVGSDEVNSSQEKKRRSGEIQSGGPPAKRRNKIFKSKVKQNQPRDDADGDEVASASADLPSDEIDCINITDTAIVKEDDSSLIDYMAYLPNEVWMTILKKLLVYGVVASDLADKHAYKQLKLVITVCRQWHTMGNRIFFGYNIFSSSRYPENRMIQFPWRRFEKWIRSLTPQNRQYIRHVRFDLIMQSGEAGLACDAKVLGGSGVFSMDRRWLNTKMNKYVDEMPALFSAIELLPGVRFVDIINVDFSAQFYSAEIPQLVQLMSPLSERRARASTPFERGRYVQSILGVPNIKALPHLKTVRVSCICRNIGLAFREYLTGIPPKVKADRDQHYQLKFTIPGQI